MDGNNKEKTISIIITSAIIFLFSCFYLFKFSFSYTIMFIIMFVIILIMISFRHNPCAVIVRNLIENYTK